MFLFPFIFWSCVVFFLHLISGILLPLIFWSCVVFFLHLISGILPSCLAILYEGFFERAGAYAIR